MEQQEHQTQRQFETLNGHGEWTQKSFADLQIGHLIRATQTSGETVRFNKEGETVGLVTGFNENKSLVVVSDLHDLKKL